jgi:hypothetical protein
MVSLCAKQRAGDWRIKGLNQRLIEIYTHRQASCLPSA